VGCLAWSKDDTILLTSAENHIKLWNTRVNDLGACSRREAYCYLHLDWPLYPIHGRTLRNCDLACMAFRRVGVYIRWFGSQDNTLGMLASLPWCSYSVFFFADGPLRT
jgi:hypothetical protein